MKTSGAIVVAGAGDREGADSAGIQHVTERDTNKHDTKPGKDWFIIDRPERGWMNANR